MKASVDFGHNKHKVIVIYFTNILYAFRLGKTNKSQYFQKEENEIIFLSYIRSIISFKKPYHRIHTYFFVSLTCLCCVDSCIVSKRPVPQSACIITTYLKTNAVVYHTTFYSTLKDWSNLPRQRDLPKYVSVEDNIGHSFKEIKCIVLNLTWRSKSQRCKDI